MAIGRRAALLLLAAGVAGCAAPAATDPAASGSAGLGETLDATEFAELIQRDGVIVMDVRTPAEYASGHLQGAVNIDVESGTFADAIEELDPAGTYAVYCRSGNRSQVAVTAMKAAGISDVHHLEGGITAWKASGGAVVTS